MVVLIDFHSLSSGFLCFSHRLDCVTCGLFIAVLSSSIFPCALILVWRVHSLPWSAGDVESTGKAMDRGGEGMAVKLVHHAAEPVRLWDR